MTIDYRLSKLTISNFRGIQNFEMEFRLGFPSIIIGANNAGKSTIINAIALALNNPSFYQWTPNEEDFFCDEKGNRSSEFTIQVHFHSANEAGYPAVKGIQKPTLIHGVQLKGRALKNGRMTHSRTLLDDQGKAVTIAPRTPLATADKEKFKDHDVGFTQYNARLDDIAAYTPEVWLYSPKNIEASLYIWKTGPFKKLSKLLAERFSSDKWVMVLSDGKTERPMPDTLRRAYDFFRETLEAFPFWVDDMKPHLEATIAQYVGSHAQIDLKPDTQTFEDWIAQQLAISLATDPQGATTPLKNMGDGWQSVIRLAALEALEKYDLTKERVVLLLEEPETHLHPHLGRKLRKVLSRLAAKGWTIVYTTHSPELVSFDENQVINRLVRSKGIVEHGVAHTDKINTDAKLQSKIDERGAHDFLFSSCVIFCEGKDDRFAIRLGFDKAGVDCDARSISVTQCGSVTAVPAFVEICTQLGIRWCAVTDEDRLPDGNVKKNTERARTKIDYFKTGRDKQVLWPGRLEDCLEITEGSATADVVTDKISQPTWKSKFPNFARPLGEIAQWIDPKLKISD